MPVSVGIAMLAVFLGVNGIAVAYALFWRRSRALFWLSSTLVVVGIAYLIFADAAETIVRSSWPIPFDDSARGRELRLLVECQKPRQLGIVLIFAPIVVVLAPVLVFKIRNHWIGILFAGALGVLFYLLYPSPIPGALAGLVFSDEVLSGPDHCRPTRQ
jgi:hypothetical protein